MSTPLASEATMKVEGSCHCGKIAYEAMVDPDRVSLCHCTDCQMLTGSAFRVSVPAPKEVFSLLTGQPLEAGEDIGPIVCSCFGIAQRQIAAEILKGTANVEAIGRRLKAGTNCGACKPEIGKLLHGAAATKPQPA